MVGLIVLADGTWFTFCGKRVVSDGWMNEDEADAIQKAFEDREQAKQQKNMLLGA